MKKCVKFNQEQLSEFLNCFAGTDEFVDFINEAQQLSQGVVDNINEAIEISNKPPDSDEGGISAERKYLMVLTGTAISVAVFYKENIEVLRQLIGKVDVVYSD